MMGEGSATLWLGWTEPVVHEVKTGNEPRLDRQLTSKKVIQHYLLLFIKKMKLSLRHR